MRRLALALTLMTLAAPALAEPLEPDDKGHGYTQAGAPAEYACQVVPSANTATAMTRRYPNGGVYAVPAAACFAWGSLVRWKADGGKVNVAYAMTSTLTFQGNLATSSGHLVVDANGPDGPGGGVALSDGETDDAVFLQKTLYRTPGARAGVCATPIVGPGRQLVYPPCRVSGDCTDMGAGSTCNTSPSESLRRSSCGFAVVQVDTANTRVCWRVDR